MYSKSFPEIMNLLKLLLLLINGALVILTKCVFGRNRLRFDGFTLSHFIFGRHTHDVFVVGDQFHDNILQIGSSCHNGPGLSVGISLLDNVSCDFSTSVVLRFFPCQLGRLRRYLWYLQISDRAWFVCGRSRWLAMTKIKTNKSEWA